MNRKWTSVTLLYVCNLLPYYIANVYIKNIVNVTSCYFLTSELNRMCYKYILNDSLKVLLKHNNHRYIFFSSVFGSFIFLCLRTYTLCFNYSEEELKWFMTSFLCMLFHRYVYKQSVLEITDLTETNNLLLGYGAALCYFHNYLKRNLECKRDLETRFRFFECRQNISMPHKLFILVPSSCKIKKYIDDSEYISRCKELESNEIDISGIPKRKFNISVYHLRYRGKSIRFALEYAMPLKALYHMVEMGLLTKEELYEQRNVFTSCFQKMLNDSNYCEQVQLIEYNDNIPGFELHDILIENIK